MPDGLLDFLFGRGPLKKAASGSPPDSNASSAPQTSAIDIAAEAQKMADRARGNDSGVASRSIKPAGPSNDSAIKARTGSLPKQKVQPNDASLKGGGGQDDD